MEVKPNRTPAYVCSLDPKSFVDMEILKTIRLTISSSRSAVQVSVKGREPIQKIAGCGYNRWGDLVGNKYDNAKRLDIYIHNRYCK